MAHTERYTGPHSPQEAEEQWKKEIRQNSTARQRSVVEALQSPLPPDNDEMATQHSTPSNAFPNAREHAQSPSGS